MRRVFRPNVAAELGEAADWYDDQSPALGRAFLGELESALERIDENPYSYRAVHLSIRRAPLHRFPYGVYFAIIDDAIHVLAVVHDARHPSIWKRRR